MKKLLVACALGLSFVGCTGYFNNAGAENEISKNTDKMDVTTTTSLEMGSYSASMQKITKQYLINKNQNAYCSAWVGINQAYPREALVVLMATPKEFETIKQSCESLGWKIDE